MMASADRNGPAASLAGPGAGRRRTRSRPAAPADPPPLPAPPPERPAALSPIDVVHQIRAPLTALRLRLETLELMVDPQARDIVHAAVLETVRLGGMLRGILDDERGRRRREVTLAARVSPCVVAAVPGAVEQILGILIDNALRFAPRASSVRVCSTRAAGRLDLHVVDAGPGMAGADLARGPERFRRGPDSDGTGLGLAIARDLLAACGGELMLRAAVPTGLDAVAVLRLR
ncbi:MAG: hypothetical protein AUG49_15005 [Catenulispora sp. 13_1_20CM_3_70_7]|nr:MAG: hypothetical protein AUG49_15005 [Catenulispora sp. 13_1_20CM_3_70_7]